MPLLCYDEMNLNIFYVPHFIIVQNHPIYDAAMQLTNRRLQSSLLCVEMCNWLWSKICNMKMLKYRFMLKLLCRNNTEEEHKEPEEVIKTVEPEESVESEEITMAELELLK